MPFLVPIVGAILGISSQNKQQKLQQQGLTAQEQIANQEMTDKQQIFKQLTDFFTPYTQSGSPFLQNIQSAAAGQNAQQGNNAAGAFRQQMGQTGMGYGPSGATASGLANIGAQQATGGAANYLANLLNNEQIKFQAASGLNTAGQMAGASQNQPNVSVGLQPANTASAVGGAGNVLQGLLGTLTGNGTAGLPGTQGGGSLPLNTAPFNPLTPGAGTPTTGGWTFGGPGEG
jgi:hypothetical protein